MRVKQNYKIKRLPCIAREAHQKSQNCICHKSCTTYTRNQVNQLKLSNKNKEDWNEVKSISSFFVKDNMVSMANSIVMNDQPDKLCKYYLYPLRSI